MRISELSQSAGVSVASIKYYLREGLLPEGVRTAATQADYGAAHLRRLGVIRALLDCGVSIADARGVLRAIDDPPPNPHDLLGTAHSALQRHDPAPVDLAAAQALAERLGWQEGMCHTDVLAGVARALHALDRAEFVVSDETMAVYLETARAIADAEIDGVPTTSAEDAVRYVVLGTVLVEPLLLALRRLAEQVASARRFATDPGESADPA